MTVCCGRRKYGTPGNTRDNTTYDTDVCELNLMKTEISTVRVTDSESASETDGIQHFFEIRRILKIQSQRIYGFRSCCYSTIYLLFIQLLS